MQRFQSNSQEETFTPLLRGEGRKSMRDSSIRFSGEELTRREIFVNNIASNSLVERVSALMGGGARRSAPFRHLTRCDVIRVNVFNTLFRVGLHPTYSTIRNDEIAVPPQRGRLGGVQPVGSTSLTRYCEECEFIPEAIQENTPLLWERIEHLTQSVKSVLGEGSSRRVSNCKIKKFRVGLVNPTYKTLNFPHPLKEGGISVSRNNFPLSIFNFPFIQQPTPKEVFQC